MASNDPLQSAVEALTDQLRTLNTFNQKVADRASQSQAVPTSGSPSPIGRGPNPAQMSLPIDPQSEPPVTGGFIPPPSGGGPSATASMPNAVPRPRQRPGDTSSSASGGTVEAPLGSGLDASGQASLFGTGNDKGTRDAMTMAMLGEHGAPAIVRNTVLGAYGIGKSIEWAQKGAEYIAAHQQVPSIVQNIVGSSPVTRALNWANENPMKAYMGVRTLQAATGAAGAINDHLKNMQDLGASLGYDAGTYAIGGFRNPASVFSQATGEGGSFELAKLRATGRTGGLTGITSDQATAATDVLVNQGFSNAPVTSKDLSGSGFTGTIAGGGNENTIMQSLMVPLMKQFPQLDPQVIGQFTGSLRNAGASVETVRNQISNFGAEAHASQMSLNDFAKAVATTGGTFEAMGSSFTGGVNQATGFQNATGISGAPEMIGKLASNPMVQGMALGQYGVLPSGLGDMNAGALGGAAKSTAEMLNHALAGIDHNVYRTVNGVRTKIADGGKMRTDQIAQMLGIPSNQVQAWLNPGDQSRQVSRTHLGEVVGNDNGAGSTGLWSELNASTAHGRKMNSKELATFNRDWHTGVDEHLAHTGISQQQIHRLDAIKDPRQRLTQMDKLLADTSATKASSVQKRDDAQTINLKFTGAAAKWFEQLNNGATPAKKLANAGGAPYNIVRNSAAGDPNLDLRGRFQPHPGR